jgi:hypothetical protein
LFALESAWLVPILAAAPLVAAKPQRLESGNVTQRIGFEDPSGDNDGAVFVPK